MAAGARIIRYVFAGILLDLALILSALLYMAARAALSFNGICSAPLSLDAFSRTCTFLEAALFEPLFLLVLMVLLFWRAVIPLLIIPPLVGLVLGIRRSGSVT